jgi:hypothetical protein
MRSLLQFALLLLLPFSYALKFELIAQAGHSAKNERCIRNFVTKDTLVVVTAIVSGNRGDGQMVNMHVRLVTRELALPSRAWESKKECPLTSVLLCSRSRMPLAMITADQKMSQARREWHSQVLRTPHSMYALRIL